MNTTTAQRLNALSQVAIATAPNWFGSVAVPLQIPDYDRPIVDPAVYHLLHFLQAFANKYANAAWDQVYAPPVGPAFPANIGDVIFRVYERNPEECEFNKDDLPALFGWRTRIDDERRADDWRTQDVQVTLKWVFPTELAQDKVTLLYPFISSLTKTLRMGVERGQDVSWVVPGDPDAKAATQGSVLVRWMHAAGRWPWFAPWTRQPLVITDHIYPCYSTILNFTERWEFDSGRQYVRAPLSSGEIKTPDGGYGDGGVVLGVMNLKG